MINISLENLIYPAVGSTDLVFHLFQRQHSSLKLIFNLVHFFLRNRVRSKKIKICLCCFRSWISSPIFLCANSLDVFVFINYLISRIFLLIMNIAFFSFLFFLSFSFLSISCFSFFLPYHIFLSFFSSVIHPFIITIIPTVQKVILQFNISAPSKKTRKCVLSLLDGIPEENVQCQFSNTHDFPEKLQQKLNNATQHFCYVN